jgi:hypothetical protein
LIAAMTRVTMPSSSQTAHHGAMALIRGTTTTTGLNGKALLDEGFYRKGQKVTWQDVDKVNLKPHSVCPDWNYTISPVQ